MVSFLFDIELWQIQDTIIQLPTPTMLGDTTKPEFMIHTVELFIFTLSVWWHRRMSNYNIASDTLTFSSNIQMCKYVETGRCAHLHVSMCYALLA